MRTNAVIVGILVAVFVGAGGSQAFAAPINPLDGRPTADVVANLAGLPYISLGTLSATDISKFSTLGLVNVAAAARPRPSRPTPVPEPGSMLLLGTALAGLGGFVRRRLGKMTVKS